MPTNYLSIFALFSSLLLAGCLGQNSYQNPETTLEDKIALMNQAQLNFIRSQESDVPVSLEELSSQALSLALSSNALYSKTNDEDSRKTYANIAKIAFQQSSDANLFRSQLAEGTFNFSSAKKKVAKLGLNLFTSAILDTAGTPREFAENAGEDPLRVSINGDE